MNLNTAPELSQNIDPFAIVMDEARNVLWIADGYNHKVRSINLHTNRLSSNDMMKSLVNPSALALDEESLWIADSATSQIHRYFDLSRINIQTA